MVFEKGNKRKVRELKGGRFSECREKRRREKPAGGAVLRTPSGLCYPLLAFTTEHGGQHSHTQPG